MATRHSLCPSDKTDEEVEILMQDRSWIKERIKWGSSLVSAECADLLGRMLCFDRHMRITAADALQHPFIQSTYRNSNRGRHLRGEAVDIIRSMTERFLAFGAEPVLVRIVLLVIVHIAGYINEETQAHRMAY